MKLYLRINKQPVVLEVDYDPPDSSVGYLGFCHAQIIEGDFQLILNDLIERKLSDKIKEILDLRLANEVTNIQLSCLGSY